MVKIAFDVDNVLADTINLWCKKVNNITGLKIIKDDISNHKIVGSVSLSPKFIYRIMAQIWEEWESLPMTEENIPEYISELEENDFVIYIVTSRPKRSEKYVIKWLNKNKLKYNKFYAIGPYSSKSKINSDFLVEDAPEHIVKFIKSNRFAFIYDQPWNRNLNLDNTLRIKSIREILFYFNIY